MKLLTTDQRFNHIVLIPVYTWGVFVLFSLALFPFFPRFSADFLFGVGIVTVNLSWIVLMRKRKEEDEEDPDKRKRKDVAGFGLLAFTALSFLSAFLFSLFYRA